MYPTGKSNLVIYKNTLMLILFGMD